jgi:signal transduction histidine kinase
MKGKIEAIVQKYLAAPVFPDDDKKTALAQLLNSYMGILFFMLLIALPFMIFAFQEKLAALLAWVVGLCVSLGGRWALRRGYVPQVAWLALISFWVVTTALMAVSGGVQGLDWVFYIPGMVAAGLFFDNLGAFLYGATGLVAGLVMLILDTHGYRLPRLFPFPPMASWFLLLFNLSMTFLPLAIYLRRLKFALMMAQREVSERQRIQIEVSRLNEELEQRVRERTAELEEANRELERYSYSISHDLRAPIRSVVGLSQIVLETHGERLPQDAHDDLQRVIQAGRLMGSLVDDLLELLRLRRKVPLRRPLAMTAIVQRICARLCAEGRGCDHVNIKIDDLPGCEADPDMIGLLWFKLLDNAIKFTRECKDAHIEVSSRPSAEGPVYFVRDNGIGFDMRYVDSVFGVFQRLHRQEQYGGTGAGLAAARRIVERHGGKIWAEAEVGKGATFFFTLGEC